MVNFKVGDKVKILRAWDDKDEHPAWVYPMDDTIGQIAIIDKLMLNTKKPKAHLTNGWWYQCEVLQPLNKQLYLFDLGYD